jgi:hypothetical protein
VAADHRQGLGRPWTVPATGQGDGGRRRYVERRAGAGTPGVRDLVQDERLLCDAGPAQADPLGGAPHLDVLRPTQRSDRGTVVSAVRGASHEHARRGETGSVSVSSAVRRPGARSSVPGQVYQLGAAQPAFASVHSVVDRLGVGAGGGPSHMGPAGEPALDVRRVYDQGHGLGRDVAVVAADGRPGAIARVTLRQTRSGRWASRRWNCGR